VKEDGANLPPRGLGRKAAQPISWHWISQLRVPKASCAARFGESVAAEASQPNDRELHPVLGRYKDKCVSVGGNVFAVSVTRVLAEAEQRQARSHGRQDDPGSGFGRLCIQQLFQLRHSQQLAEL